MGSYPNLLLIICDDLAYGDLACHGNPYRAAGRLDRLFEQSGRLSRYCSGPMCAPARASLMTGRHYYRTGVIDTSAGRAMMHSDEVTMAQVAKGAGYRTGLFGKWHLGDVHPLRAIDRGFDEAVTFNAGYIGQLPYPEETGYWDPVLERNGTWERFAGYCTDVFTDEAIRFIRDRGERPFYVQVAYNCPHTPLDIGAEWVEPYRSQGLPEPFAKVYGMVDNIDVNVGRLLDTLDEIGLADETIVIFTSDHGPCPGAAYEGTDRFNAGLRGRKGTVYDGGLRVPFFFRWPSRVQAGVEVDVPTNPIDVLPTLAGACGWELPEETSIDGENLFPCLTAAGERADAGERDGESERGAPGRAGLLNRRLLNRSLFIQQDRMVDVPRLGQNFAVINRRFKLCRPQIDAPNELYDLIADPQERRDIAPQHPDVVARMWSEYEAWFADVEGDRHFAPPRLVVGTTAGDPVVLSRQDWLGPERVHMQDDEVGYWEVTFAADGRYDAVIHLPSLAGEGALHFGWGESHHVVGASATERVMHVTGLEAGAGDARIQAWVEEEGGDRKGAEYVEVKRRM